MQQNNSRDLNSEFLLAELDWSPEKRDESIRVVYRFVVEHARTAIRWYLRRNARVRSCAKCLRIGAIFLTMIAGLIPLLIQMYPKLKIFSVTIGPAWASVALVIAATFVAFDSFFGYSRSWMRFITAVIKIKSLLEEFEISWQTKLAGFHEHPINDEHTLELLGACQYFLTEVNRIIIEETEQWKQDFQSALKKIDESTKQVKSRS